MLKEMRVEVKEQKNMTIYVSNTVNMVLSHLLNKLKLSECYYQFVNLIKNIFFWKIKTILKLCIVGLKKGNEYAKMDDN